MNIDIGTYEYPAILQITFASLLPTKSSQTDPQKSETFISTRPDFPLDKRVSFICSGYSKI